MKRILVLGANGLLGHYLVAGLAENCSVAGTLHQPAECYSNEIGSLAMFYGVDAVNMATVCRAIDSFRPDWVINAIGLVKRPRAVERLQSLEVNTLFPHRLASCCEERGIFLMHFSTDCIFDGRKGNYHESDRPDNPDWHGRCKAMGEPTGAKVLVLRASFIGLELGCKRSLVEWFLAQKGGIPGYTKAIWNGLTAAELTRLVARLVNAENPLSGLWHVASPTSVSKYELLSILNQRLGRRDCEVIPDDSFVCDRSLDGSAFRRAFPYAVPEIAIQLDELAEEIKASRQLV